MNEPAGELRCGLCHDALSVADQVRCPGCATLLHAECRAQLGRCPTLGCAQGAAPAPSKPPAYGLFTEREIVWLGILLSPAAGVALLATNWFRVGLRARALGVVALVMGLLLLGALLAPARPGGGGVFLCVAVAVAIGLGRLGRPAIEAHTRAGGSRGHGCAALALALGGLALYFVLAGCVVGLLHTGLWYAIEDRLAADDRAAVERLAGYALVLQDDKDAHALSARAIVRVRGKRLEEARADIERALRLSPADPAILTLRGHTHLLAGDARTAIGDLDRSIRLAPDYAWSYANRRWARSLLGDLEGSIQDAEVAARLDPSAENVKSLAELRAQAR